MFRRTWLLVTGAAVVIAGASGVAYGASSSTSPHPTVAPVAASEPRDTAFARSMFSGRGLALLATRLGVSDAKARQIAGQILKLTAAKGGIEPASPEFAAIAKDTGTTPRQLGAALDAVKKAG